MNKDRIINSIEGKINNIFANAAVLTTEGLSIKQKFFNEILKDYEESRLKELIKNYDSVEDKGVFSVIASNDIDPLTIVRESYSIPVDELDNLKTVIYEKIKAAGIIRFSETQFDDDKEIADFVLEALGHKLIKTENRIILNTLNAKESIDIASVKGGEGTDALISIINSNLRQDSIKRGSVIANHSFYKEIDNFTNRANGILRKEQDSLYYLDKPLYVVEDEHLEDTAPIAFIGNFNRAAAFIEDKKGNVNIKINTQTGLLTDEIFARIVARFDVKELLADSYIKVTVKEGV